MEDVKKKIIELIDVLNKKDLDVQSRASAILNDSIIMPVKRKLLVRHIEETEKEKEEE